jgi:hypothetical protein
LDAFGLLNPYFNSFDYGEDNSFRLGGARLFAKGFLDGFNKFCFRHFSAFYGASITFKQAWTSAFTDFRSSFNPRATSVSLSPTFFIAKTQQQRFKLIKCLLLTGPDQDDAAP